VSACECACACVSTSRTHIYICVYILTRTHTHSCTLSVPEVLPSDMMAFTECDASDIVATLSRVLEEKRASKVDKQVGVVRA
jgi:hypothetical protein